MLPLPTSRQLSSGRHPWRAASIAIAALAAATIAAACGSTSTTSVGPTPQRCELTLSATPNPAPAAGGAIVLAVTAAPECQWNATENVSWITQMTPASGQGDGRVTLTAAANTTLAARQDNVTVNGVTAMIRQEAGTCSHQLSALSTTVTADARTVPVTVTVISGCPWTAVSNAGFITVASGASGSANGTVSLNIAANPVAASRQGTVTIAGQTFTVTQGGANCTYSVAPMSEAFAFGGGPGSATVTSPEGCAWSTTSSANFVSITSGGSGSGTGAVTYNVTRNGTLQARSGILTIAGQTFTVNQEALVCEYAISPTSQTIAAGGGSGSVAVSATSGCGWTVTNNNPAFVTVTGGGGGGNTDGTVSFNVSANATANGRSGTLTIAGQTFTINQAGVACSFSIAPTSQAIAAAGGTGTTTVTAPAGCGWTATSNDAFITLTSGASGTGGGTTAFAVAANAGAPRSGTLTIAGQTFTVNQASGCSYSIAPTSLAPTAAGGPGTATITTTAGCAWTSVSNAAFITVTGGASGSGNGATTFTVAANTGPARTGTLTIAGQTFTVNQASGCTFSIAPAALTVAAAGGPGSSTVTAGAGCAWTSVSNAPFITVATGAAGSGSGATTFTVAANTGAARNGTLTIAGQTFAVTQEPLCTYAITPMSRAHGNLSNLTGSVAVTATAGCAWTASTNSPAVVNIVTGASGTGNGTINYVVTIQLSGTRTGSLTIAGQPFTVTQGP